MHTAFRVDSGFTLVELMVVVLIIGILVSLATPVFLRAEADARSKSCQANQRTLVSAMSVAQAAGLDFSSATAGALSPGGSGWYGLMIPSWVLTKPVCPTDQAEYLMAKSGAILGDNGAAPGFKDQHQLP